MNKLCSTLYSAVNLDINVDISLWSVDLYKSWVHHGYLCNENHEYCFTVDCKVIKVKVVSCLPYSTINVQLWRFCPSQEHTKCSICQVHLNRIIHLFIVFTQELVEIHMGKGGGTLVHFSLDLKMCCEFLPKTPLLFHF